MAAGTDDQPFEESGLSDDRRQDDRTGREPPLVTYSRIPREPAPRRAPSPDHRAEPRFSAVEVPPVDPPDYADDFDDVPEIRAEPPIGGRRAAVGLDPDFKPRRKRSRLGLVLTMAAVGAILVGIAVVAANFAKTGKLATPTTVVEKTGEAVDGATPAEGEDAVPVVRQITIAPSASAPSAAAQADAVPATDAVTGPAPAAAVLEPPVPRLRPERVATAPGDVAAPPADAGAPASPLRQTVAPDAATPATPAPAGDDEFLARIERTLAAKRAAPDASLGAPAAVAPVAPAIPAPIVEPAPVIVAPASVPEPVATLPDLSTAPEPLLVPDGFGTPDPVGEPLDLNPQLPIRLPPEPIPNTGAQ